LDLTGLLTAAVQLLRLVMEVSARAGEDVTNELSARVVGGEDDWGELICDDELSCVSEEVVVICLRSVE
jgi:hypothetical protein